MKAVLKTIVVLILAPFIAFYALSPLVFGFIIGEVQNILKNGERFFDELFNREQGGKR